MKREIVTCLIFALGLSAQQQTTKPSAQSKKASPKKLVTPNEEPGYTLSPILFKDPGCARDYLRALAAGGLEQRKQIAELVAYGCMRRLEGLYMTVAVSDKKTITINDKRVVIDEISLVVATRLEESLAGRVLDHDSYFEDGWIIDSQRLRLSDDEMEAYIARAKKAKSEHN